MPLTLEIDIAEIEGLASMLELDGKHAMAAARWAAIRTARWARVQIARGLSSRLGIGQAALKNRIGKPRRTREGAKLWIGLNPINLKHLNPRKTRRGLRAGKLEFPGAFIMRNPKGGRAAVRRRGRARLPVDAVNLNLASDAEQVINVHVVPALEERFIKLYREELDRRLQRKGR